jgi:hypothetical protein
VIRARFRVVRSPSELSACPRPFHRRSPQRIETDADGHAAYEAHMLKADGTPATVYVDKSFDVVGVESH